MIVIGIMCVKDEGDLLPEVLTSLRNKLDFLYVYDDGSIDNTFDILKSFDNISYLIKKEEDTSRIDIGRANYHHLLEKIKKDFNCIKENIWIVITMGDRFFLNKTPREIVERADTQGYDAVEGIQLDFVRHRLEGWIQEIDTYPIYPISLRRLCRWFYVDERAHIAFKLTEDKSYLNSKYPWPKGIKNLMYRELVKTNSLSIDMPFLEHQGRRSPNAFITRYKNGSRKVSKKIDTTGFDLLKYDDVKSLFSRFYMPYRVLPWIDNSSLQILVDMYNDERLNGLRDRIQSRYFYWGAEQAVKSGLVVPERRDL